MNRKGATTLFIFLGILILLTMIVLVTLLAQSEETADQEQQILTRSEMQPIQDYVERCLELVSEEAIDLIGRQGFALYTSQGGTVPGIDPNKEGIDYVSYGTDFVSFRITMTPENTINDQGKSIISNSKTTTEQFGDTTMLVYPWATYPNDPFTGETSTYLSSGFGWNALPPLNRIGPHSIEAQIEGYINKRIQDCTDWKNYPSFTVKPGAISTQVIFANKNTLITVKWPIELFDTTNRRGLLESFLTRVPVRLGTIHRFANLIIDQDVNNVSFDIRQNGTEFDVFVEEHPTGHSIVRILDPLSTLNARPYEARFARENRPPALHQTSQDELNTPNAAYLLGTCEGAIITFADNTFSVQQGTSDCESKINITLRADDPDEEPVSFRVAGRLGVPHQLTERDVQSPFPCIPYTLSASDGTDQDFQEINLRLKSIQFSPQCVQR